MKNLITKLKLVAIILIILTIVFTVVYAGLDSKEGKVVNVKSPTDPNDAVNLEYLEDYSSSTYAPKDHNITSTDHGDAVEDAVSRGSLIYGNATPKWDELIIGDANQVLHSDGTDIAWADPNVFLDHTLTSTWLDIQGGTTDEYFHFTDAEHTEVTEWIDDVILYSDGDISIEIHDFNNVGKVRGGTALFGGVGTFRTSATSGAGTPGDPYILYDATQLQTMSNDLTASYQLGADIDMVGVTWTPVGTISNEFTGTFDGDGRIITNFTMTGTGTQLYRGLFGYVDGATIEDVVLQNVSMTFSYLGNTGALIGYMRNASTVQDCFVSGTISATGGFQSIGGLIGYVTSMSGSQETVQRCGSTVNISGAVNASSGMGGLIGYVIGNVDVLNCYSRGTVTYPTSGIVASTGVAPLIGQVRDAGVGTVITNCYSTGAISPKNPFEESAEVRTKGGFIGWSDDRVETYTDCFWDTETTGGISAGDGTNEVQRYTMTGNASSGSYDITFGGNTATMQWDDDETETQTEMDTSIGTDEITVWTVNGGRFTQNNDLYLIFNENNFETDVAMTTFTDNLTGGTINNPTEHASAGTAIGAAEDVRGKTTAQMMAQATFDEGGSSWDFTDIWEIDEGAGYPTLQAFEEFDSSASALHRFGTTVDLAAKVIANSADNVLIEGDLEVQGTQLVMSNGGDIITSGDFILSSLTAGRVVFVGTGGVLDDDGELLWNNTTKILTTTGMTVTGNSVFGLNSSVFQPTTDSTTFFQVLDADGGTPILNVDSTNERIGFGTAIPGAKVEVNSGDIFLKGDTGFGYGQSLRIYDEDASDNLRVFLDNDVTNLIASGFILMQSGTGKYCAFTSGSYFNLISAAGNHMYLNCGGNFYFRDVDAANALRVTIDSANSATEWTGTAPYLTLHNETHELDGRESKIIFKGEQAGGEETTLAIIEVGHDSGVDNEEGYLDLFINDGDDGDSPTHTIRVDSVGLRMQDDKLIAVDVNAGITASTAQTQGNGALTAQVNEISTVANDGDNVTLPSAVTGIEIEIINNGANTLQIFPASGDNLGLGVDTAEELEANERVKFVAYTTTNWAKESTTEIIHAEIHDQDNTDAFVINVKTDFHSYHTNGLAQGDLADWTFDAGGGGTSHTIDSIADGADTGVDIEVTTGDNHLLEDGDIVSQTNLTSAVYTGIFIVKDIISSTQYEVAAAYTATDTGTMDQAATLEADAVAAGVYDFAYYISGTLVGNNETFDFQLYNETTAIIGSKIRRKFGAANDFGSMSGGGVVAVGNGEKISFALSNEDSAANIIIRNLTIVLVRL